MLPPGRTVIPRAGGIYALERALQRRGFAHVAGADEAGRGACAGPLVAAAVILPEGRRGEIDGLNDSKLLTPLARDRIMCELDQRHPEYGFAEHKGYCTPEHTEALHRHGPCPEHRFSYANVAAVAGRSPRRGTVGVAPGEGLLPRARVRDNGGMVGVEGGAQ